jgi:quercetin dioxygenase-like cupin family protein
VNSKGGSHDNAAIDQVGSLVFRHAAGQHRHRCERTGVPEPKGPVAKPLLNLDLAPEMDGVQDRVMRMQLTTYEPGASNKLHSHKDRPEVVYILSGKVIEHRGDVAKEYGPGDTFTADRNTNHWMENKGTVPAVMLVTGIAKKE